MAVDPHSAPLRRLAGGSEPAASGRRLAGAPRARHGRAHHCLSPRPSTRTRLRRLAAGTERPPMSESAHGPSTQPRAIDLLYHDGRLMSPDFGRIVGWLAVTRVVSHRTLRRRC